MMRSFSNHSIATWIGIGFALLNSTNILAALPEEEYLSQLKAAQESVIRKRQSIDTFQMRTAENGSVSARSEFHVGETWQIAAWQIDSAMMRKVEPVQDHSDLIRTKGLFRYDVIEVSQGPSDLESHQKVRIRITPIQNHDFKLIDSRVQSIEITVIDSTQQIDKKFFLKGRSDPISVQPVGFQSEITPLELLPLDFPDLITAVRSAKPRFPEIPHEISNQAQEIGFKPELSRSELFEQEDFFGRPLQVLWQKGDPWPTYRRSPRGVAVLIKR